MQLFFYYKYATEVQNYSFISFAQVLFEHWEFLYNIV